MSFAIDKRPVDVIQHSLDFTNYLPDGKVVTAATAKVVGEDDNLLVVQAIDVASPLVTLTLEGGTARGIYQVYVTATFGNPA